MSRSLWNDTMDGKSAKPRDDRWVCTCSNCQRDVQRGETVVCNDCVTERAEQAYEQGKRDGAAERE